jgi:RNA polymerase sigma-70 factor (ECF subfamily)
LKAHRGYAGFRGDDAKAWLLTIVRRQFIDWSNARRAGRAVFADSDDGVEEGVASEADSAETLLLRQGEIGAVRRAIEGLPEPFREAIVLRELEELSYRQVAEITGVPIGTVMSRLARARDMLAKRLAPAGEAVR